MVLSRGKGNQRCEQESEYKEMEDWILRVAVVLLQAGCSTTETDSSGRTSEKVALDNGWPKLASLIQQWHDYKNCVMLKHLASKSHSDDNLECCFRRLPDECWCHLVEFVAHHCSHIDDNTENVRGNPMLLSSTGPCQNHCLDPG